MESVLFDLRYALRSLVHRPGFTALAVLTLAIGIGVNAVAFSAVNALLLKPFDIPGSESLGWVMTKSPGDPHGSISLPDYQDLARHARTFDALIAEGRQPVSVRVQGRTKEGWALVVSANYLEVLGERPMLGRTFAAPDLSASELPVLVSARFWASDMGGGDTIAGRTLTINGRSFAVVGVVRDGFQGPGGLYEPDLWLPLERVDALNVRGELRDRRNRWLTVVGRTRPEAADADVEAELQGIFRQLAVDHPATNTERSATWSPMRAGHPDLRGIASMVWIALGVVGVVLLIACFNVAGLLLARAADRQREIGVRSALGASRGRILRQLVTEGTLLAMMSGIAALVVAAWSASLLSAFSLPAPIPQRLHMRVDMRLVAFVAGLVAIAGILPALVPALHATRGDIFRAMKDVFSSGGRPARARNAFVIAQVAGSTLFLAGALLFVRSFTNMAAFDPGFDTGRTMVLELDPGTFGYDAARSRAFFAQLHERIATIPGIAAVAIADRVPFYVEYPNQAEVSTDGTDCSTADCRRATTYAVGPGHFRALGVALIAGRDLTAQDVKSGGAVVVSNRMAQQFWPGQDAVGATFRMGTDGRTVEVVGVVADITHRSLGEPPAPYVYRTLADADYARGLTVIVRASRDPRDLLGPVQEQVQAVDPALPARTARTLAQRMEMPLWPARTLAGFFSICGILALVLATVGLFGVTYYAVSQRTREFGIRVALGATRRNVIRLVLRDGLLLTTPGVVLGILGALVGARLLARALFGISPGDPATFAATAALQGLVTLAACALPAWRATKADPILALRQE